MSQINSADLTYFSEIARTLNLSRAAERLGVTQPSLSLAIKRLESSVGTPLLIRKRQGVSLTDAGKVLLQESENFLRTWENIISRVQSSQNEVQGVIRLGAHPAVALYSLPLFLKSFLDRHPEVEVRLVHDLSRKIAEGVISQQIDIGLVINPVAHPDLVIRKLANDRVTFWRSKNHRKTHGQRLIADLDLVQTQSLLRKAAKWIGPEMRILPTSQLDIARELCALGPRELRVTETPRSSPSKGRPSSWTSSQWSTGSNEKSKNSSRFSPSRSQKAFAHRVTTLIMMKQRSSFIS
jgi:LysR family transcriptional regulator, cell division regulator